MLPWSFCFRPRLALGGPWIADSYFRHRVLLGACGKKSACSIVPEKLYWPKRSWAFWCTAVTYSIVAHQQPSPEDPMEILSANARFALATSTFGGVTCCNGTSLSPQVCNLGGPWQTASYFRHRVLLGACGKKSACSTVPETYFQDVGPFGKLFSLFAPTGTL